MAKSRRLDMFGLHLHLATNQYEWDTLRTKRFKGSDMADEPDSLGCCQFMVDTHDNNTPHVVIWLDPRVQDDQRTLVATIAHESFHAAAQVFDHVGQEAKQHDSEYLAYLVETIAGWCWENVA